MKEIKQLQAKDIKPLRKHILKKQNGVCWICEKYPDRPTLDHHHIKKIKGTGQVRGVLCSNCNIFLAKSENNCVRYGIDRDNLPTILRKIADYLEKPQYPYIHPSEAPKSPKLQKNSFKKIAKLYSAKYPNRKELWYPKSGKLTKLLKSVYEEFNIEPEFLKGK